MATQTEDGRGVQGGPAQAVYIINESLPAPEGGGGTQNVAVVSAIPAGTNNIGDVDLASAIPAGSNLIGGTTIYGSSGAPITGGAFGGSDGNSTGFALLATFAESMLFNGASWDRERSNINSTILSSAARTTTTNSADQTNHNGRRLLLVVNVSSAGTGSITPSIQIKDSISGNYVTTWTAAAAITTTTTATYYFADGGAGGLFTEVRAAGLSARDWRLVMTHNNANSITYSVSAAVLV